MFTPWVIKTEKRGFDIPTESCYFANISAHLEFLSGDHKRTTGICVLDSALTTGTKRVNCAGSAVEFGGVRLVKCGILATARCSACMNNECTGGGGGSGACAILQTTERSCLFVQCPSTDVKRF